MENQKPIAPAFSVGNTVKLKSGGPIMTVKTLKHHTLYIDDKGQPNEGFVGFIVCSWFNEITNELKTEVFTQDMLMAFDNYGQEEKNIPVVVNKHI